MKKVISLVLLATMSVSVLAGCGKAATSSTTTKKDITLNVLTSRTDIVGTTLKKFGDDYKAKTGVTIKWEGITDYNGDVKVRLNSKNYGDVLYIPSGIPTSDLGQFFEPLGKSTDDKVKDYAFNTTYATKETDGTYTTYGLGYGMSADGIVYNKATFKKAGIEKFPTTLTGLYDACAKLKAAGVVPVATNFKDKWPLSQYDSMAIPMSGDANYNNFMYKETAPFSADKPYGKALEVLYKLVSSGWVEKDLTTTNWEQSKPDLGTGKIGMMFLGTWAIPQMQEFATNKDDIGFAPIPTNETGKLVANTGIDSCLAVSKNSENKKAAQDFLYAFIGSDYGDKNGFIPAKTGVESTNPVIKEFIASGVTLLKATPDPEAADKMSKIGNKATVDFYGGLYTQNFAIAAKKSRAEFDKIVKDYNDKWSKAKTTLNY